MRQLLVAMFTFMALASQLRAEDMLQYLRDTEEMIRHGKHKEALERLVWFHEHAIEHDRGISGVRLSSALRLWKELGDDYRPAMQALIETRDRKTSQFQTESGSSSVFQDVAALNRTLGDRDKTVKLFQLIHEQHPLLARQCWIFAKDDVLSAGRYDLAHYYLDNPVRDFLRIKAFYDLRNAGFYGNDAPSSIRGREMNDEHFVEQTLMLIRVSIALGEKGAAKEIQRRALDVIDDQRLRDAIDPK